MCQCLNLNRTFENAAYFVPDKYDLNFVAKITQRNETDAHT